MSIGLIQYRLLYHSLFLPWLSLALIIASIFLGFYGKSHVSKKFSILSALSLACGCCLILIYMALHDGIGWTLLRIGAFLLVSILAFVCITQYKDRKK